MKTIWHHRSNPPKISGDYVIHNPGWETSAIAFYDVDKAEWGGSSVYSMPFIYDKLAEFLYWTQFPELSFYIGRNFPKGWKNES